jgi:hypothetical protein
VLKKILYAIFLIGLIGVGVALFVLFKPHKKVENTKGMTVEATLLAKEYSENESAANTKYLNQAVEVKGVVATVEKNQDGWTVITLESGDPMNAVMCTMREKDVTATKGQNVRIKGFCSGYNFGVLLTDCIIK